MTRFLILILALAVITSCTSKSELGSADHPIHFSLVPGQDTQLLTENGKQLQAYLEKETGLHFDVNVPVSYIAVIEALGSKRADVAIMNTFGYLLAHEKYGAVAALTGMYKGRDVYWGQILVRKDGPKTLQELNNKRIAFVDPSSGSGFVLPAKLLKDAHVTPKEVIFAGRHDSVVTMLYQKRVDAGATYHTPAENGVPQDARKLVLTQFPDVFDQIVILTKTDSIPNDPVVFRKDFPPELKAKIIAALKHMVRDEKSKIVLYNLYHMDDLKDANLADYDHVQKVLLDLGKSAQDLIK